MDEFQKLYDFLEENEICVIYTKANDFGSCEEILVWFDKYDIREVLSIFDEFDNVDLNANVRYDEIVIDILPLIENNALTLDEEIYWKDKFKELY